MTKFKPFRCGECGATVKRKTGPGRVREYRRGVPLPIPSGFAIPTCTACGEEYLSLEEAQRLDDAQRPAFLKWQGAHCREVVARIKTAHGVTLREIERACGVTGTYLSHVLAGRKEASATLLYLLEAYAASPSEFRRRITGASWPDAMQPLNVPDQYGPARSMGATPALVLPELSGSVAASEYSTPTAEFAAPANDVEAA